MSEPTYYEIVPAVPFTTANTVFLPDRKYIVTADIYASSLTDGSVFSDRCKSATPRFGVPG